MLTASLKTIFALIDELRFASGEQYFLDVGARVVHPECRTRYVATICVKTRNGSAPVFCDDGEQCLWACANTQEEANQKLAALCSVVTVSA